MINFKLSKEIYGLTPWMMDIHSIPVMTSILDNMRNGVKFEAVTEKLNSVSIITPTSETRLVSRPWQLNSSESFDAIGIINLNGPITKNGGASSYGMIKLSKMMYQMAADNRIKAFLIPTDSGGGSSAAVKIMSDTIREIDKIKPVYSIIEKGGMAASAAYGIISGSRKIYSEDAMNMVGSVGTMIQFEGREANTTSPDGVKTIRLYATKSVKKNAEFEEALNNNNYKPLINEMLDPINQEFIDMVLSNRPKLDKSNFDNGAIHFSKDVVGTFVDEIKSFAEVVDMIKSKHFNQTKKSEFNTNINNRNMTKAEFKTANPTAYNEIVAEGIAQEKDRSGAWMAHVNTDVEAVKKGIESGESISQSQREAFFVKQNSKDTVKKIKSESADDVVAPESITDAEKINKDKKVAEVDAAFGFDLK